MGSAPLVAFVLALLTVLTACGSGSNRTPSSPPPSDGTPITGREQIAWDQAAGSQGELNGYRFALYVDGTRVELPTAGCGGLSNGSAVCQAPLPPLTIGRHALELVSRSAEGAESEKSVPLIVIVGASGSVSFEAPTTTAVDGATRRDASRAAVCSVAAAADGTTYLSVPSGRIRRFDAGGGQMDVRWRAPGDEPLILRDLVLHPDYEQNRWLYLLLTSSAPPAGGRLVLARYREAAGVLGEASVLVDRPVDLPLERPIVRLDSEGRIYIALLDRIASSAAADRPAPARRFLIRLNQDGTVPRDNPAASPLLPWRAVSPAAFDWDATGRPWVLERSGSSSYRARPADAPERGLIVVTDEAVAMGHLPRRAEAVVDLWVVAADGRAVAIAPVASGSRPRGFELASADPIGAAVFTPETIVYCHGIGVEQAAYSLGAFRRPY